MSLNKNLVLTPIIIDPNLKLPFKMTCDASGVVAGVVIWKWNNKFFHNIYYD